MVARALSRIWVSMALGAVLVGIGGELGGMAVRAQSRPSRAHQQLTTGIDCLRRGDLELAEKFFQQAKAVEEDLTPTERQELAGRLQFVEMALKARQEGGELLQKAEEAAKASRTQEALTLLRQVAANQYLRPADKQRAQELAERLQPKSAAPPQVHSTSGGGELLRVRTMLKNARGLLSKGEYEAAEALAKEAKGVKVTYTPGEDTPDKVLEDVGRARIAKLDAKSALAAARAALERGDLDRAEQLAKESEKAESFWTFHLWGDSPAKVLKEVKDARAKMAMNTAKDAPGAKPPIPPKDSTVAKGPEQARDSSLGKASMAPKENPVAKGPTTPKDNSVTKTPPPPKDTAVAKDPATPKDKVTPAASARPKESTTVGKLPMPPARDTEQARQLLKQGRKALQEKNYAEAERLAKQAREKNPDLNWWEDNPEKLLADVRRAAPRESKSASADIELVSASDKKAKTGEKPTAAAKTATSNDDARTLLRQARDLYDHGKLDEAKELALKANAAHVRWGLFEDSPDKLLGDIQKARTARDREESVRLLAEARKLFEQGNLDEAERKAYQAERLHGSYSLWDLGDRPQKLVAEIEAVRARNRRSKSLPPPPVQVAQGTTSTAEKPAPAAAVVNNAPSKAPLPIVSNTAPPPPTTPTPAGQATSVAQNQPPTPDYHPNTSPLGGGVRPEPARAQADFAKQQAKQLLQECRNLQKVGRLIDAQAKAKEAQKVGARFDSWEDRPELALQELAALAEKQIENLTQAAADHASQGQADPSRFQRAEHDLAQARQLAAAFGLDPQPIDSSLNRLRHLQGQATAAAPAQPNPVTPASLVQDDKRQRGLQLLDQARMELRKGETAVARRIAEEAFSGPYGVQGEAAALLRSIDAEEFNVRLRAEKRKVDVIVEAYRRKDFAQAKALAEQVDVAHLPPDQKARLRSIMESPELQPKAVAKHQAKTDTAVVPASNTTAGPDKFAEQVAAMQEIKFQEMRAEGIRAQQEALERFQANKPDQAIEILQSYRNRLEESGLEPDRVTLLRRPVEARLQDFRKFKAQKEFEAIARDQSMQAKNRLAQKAIAEDQKRKQVAELMDKYKTFHKEGKYKEAEMYAMKAHELDPDNPVTGAAIYTARVLRNQQYAEGVKKRNSEHDIYDLTDASDMGEAVNTRNPVSVDTKRSELARSRGSIKNIEIYKKSEKEKEIERSLNRPISLEFKETPLRNVIDDLRDLTGINIITDQPALDEDGISQDRPITLKLDQVSMKSALNLLLHQVHLTYVIKDEVLQITTERHARGKLVQRTYPVADLIIPVDNYIVPPPASFMHALGRDASQQGNVQMAGVTPILPRNGMMSGQPVSSSMSMSENQPAPDGQGANGLQNLKASTRAPGQTDTMHDLLIKLITSTIEPKSWADVGGPGTIDYFPLGMALVINQVPNVQEQVAQLLDALRQIQDLEVSVEVRMISLEESFFERIGLDFNLNIKTDRITNEFEPQIVTQQFKPANHINDPFPKRLLVGVQPAGSGGSFSPTQGFSALTPDLDIPIRSSSFNLAIPTFGGFPNIPGANGGLSMGLAFLSDIQVFMFMEAAQGDRRTNVLQAPKLTLFNGQTSTIVIQDFQWFVTNVQVVQNGGQVVFVPQNQPIPMGINLAIQAVISADRRYVRVNIAPTMTNLASATVPLFPITTFITPVFEGGAQGQPVPFTQFIQQPTFTTMTIQTTVSVPDGGTVLLGGLKLMNEGRNEFGPPILSKIPYINRLFKNVGYGKDTSSLLIMVTPRIIINSEEEFLATGVGGPPAP